jgi:hypothetical protein
LFPNNRDAVFESFHINMPADTLLRYNYGAAAVKQWGKNIDILSTREGLPRPQIPEVLPVGPEKGVNDRMTAINKLALARGEAGQVQPADDGDGEGSAALADSEQLKWDEDDVMLFFWGNSKASVERHAKAEREREQNINEWRKGTF